MKTLLTSFLSCAALASLQATVVISELDLIGDKVELVNAGPGNVDLTGYFLCNRLTGAPFYVALTTSLIDLPHSTDNNLLLAPGDVMTLQLTASFITDASGEFGLYLNNTSFGNAANIVDYVGWGADGVRDSVAATAGIWVNGTFVNVAGSGPGQTIQLGFGLPGNSVSDYQINPSTIGFAQSVPEPSSFAIMMLGGIALLARRSQRKG
jgi:hypothetical protein